MSVASCVRVDTCRLEAFFVVPDVPDGVYSNAKAKKLLGWEPVDKLERFFTRDPPQARM